MTSDPDELESPSTSDAGDAPAFGQAGPNPRPFPVVGIGASAGGLEALQAFFTNMPVDGGLALVVITHQHPEHKSLLPELLARRSALPMVEVSTVTEVQPDHVYFPAPGRSLSLLGDFLHPVERTPNGPGQFPIDHFFTSLAHARKDAAVGIILSGTGSDGTQGLKEIKAALGMVMVQREASARYAGMPHSAIATELVDYVLEVEQMPAQLLAYVRTPYPNVHEADAKRDTSLPPQVQRIFLLLRDRLGHDFSLYKTSTVGRRLERRIKVHNLHGLDQYVDFLHEHPAELDLLFKELLIGVTSFFRDAEAFEMLGEALLELLASRPADHPFRAWVAGCSTGEEAYSIAIVLRECTERLGIPCRVQIFATDLDPSAIDVARAGTYPLGIAADVSAERLARFFSREQESYRIRKDLREMVVFAQQNLIGDPPFTKLDLLSCRNLLIYLDARLQKRLIPMFHYALRPGGLLFLGSSESVGSYGDLFQTRDKKWKLFDRRPGDPTPIGELPLAFGGPEGPPAALGPRAPRSTRIDRATERLLLDELVPPTVLVHERGEIVHIHGKTGLFLEPAQGPQESANIFNMLREGLPTEVAAALRSASGGARGEVIRRNLPVKTNGQGLYVDVRVRRVQGSEAFRSMFLISFERPRAVSDDESSAEAEGPADLGRIHELERELKYTREGHQGTIEELETANEELQSTNEELQSTNEELQSTNEELQSTNEELETSKEEMQSLNEELQTVNSELHGKVEELSRANDDMKNLLNATDIATVFLDSELHIKRYTERARRVIRLIPSDAGRPIQDLVSRIRYDRLVEDAREVLRTLVFKETEVLSDTGERYLMRILPYRTTENLIDGLVVSFVDITAVSQLRESEQRLLRGLRESPTTIFGQDTDLRITWASGPLFGRSVEELIGKTDAELLGEAQAGPVIELKRQALRTGNGGRGRFEMATPAGTASYDLLVQSHRDEAGQVAALSCVATRVE